MKNKIKAGFIFILFVVLIFTPVCQANEIASKNKQCALSHGIINVKGIINIEYNSMATSDPIIPLSGPRFISLNISYIVVGLFANSIVKLLHRRGFVVPIKLSIEEKPDWCTAIIAPNTVYNKISDEGPKSQATLIVSVDQTAPAYTLSTIKLKAESALVKGRLGILTLIASAEAKFEISIIPGYLPLINVMMPEGNFKNVVPDQQADFNITIENLGNAKTKISSEVLYKPENWSVSLPSSVIIDVNDLAEIQLIFRTDENFTGMEIIQVAFTPSFYADSNQTGITWIETFIIKAAT